MQNLFLKKFKKELYRPLNDKEKLIFNRYFKFKIIYNYTLGAIFKILTYIENNQELTMHISVAIVAMFTKYCFD